MYATTRNWIIGFSPRIGEGEGGDTDDGNVDGGDDKTIDTLPDDKTFTGTDVNRIVSQRLSREHKKMQQTLDQVEEMQSKLKLEEKERQQLQESLTNLQRTYKSKEQIAKDEADRERKKRDGELQTALQEKEKTEQLLNDFVKRNQITDAAVSAGAAVPEQIVGLLLQRARVALGDDGTQFTTTVQIDALDEDGKRVTLDLPIQEALQKMKTSTALYGNLFKDEKNGGVGSTNVRTTDDSPKKVESMSDWDKVREKVMGDS